MKDHLYVIVTLSPFYVLTDQSAGNTKEFLVEVPKTAIEKIENPPAKTLIAVELAIQTALEACTTRFGLDSGIGYHIDTRPATLEHNDKQSLEAPYVFNDCQAWMCHRAVVTSRANSGSTRVVSRNFRATIGQ
jgi:hypothetical protein